MITIKMAGGLGNQFFQYACGHALAKRHNSELALDISFYKQTTWRRSVKNIIFSSLQGKIKEGLAINQRDKRPFILSDFPITARLLTNPIKSSGSIIEKDPFSYDPLIYNGPDNATYQGYFNSEKYFSQHSLEIRQIFTPHSGCLNSEGLELARQIKSQANPVSVHVRRGDYLTNPEARRWHGEIAQTYYRQALKIIMEKHPNPHLFIFSDEPSWCLKNLNLSQPTTVVFGQSAVSDLLLMSMCRHHIIANSTFSWWGAWLNAQPDKIVIAPAQWLAKRNLKNSDLFPKDWIII